ncbi:MAG: carboxylesterase family protein [Nocardioides sp.]|uniref:carboxylesterase/lipase family protein n=1 Tax=Nocardioides sp. TaxID=35761 RepID=UPI0039E6CF8A
MSATGIGVVRTTHGSVRGIEQRDRYAGITVFNGIPYAAPPIGPRRWAPPAEAEPWDGVRPATSFPPAAVQQFHNDWFAKEGYVPGYYDSVPPMSEDCLYLNLATGAAGPGEQRPVFVWFHGGGLTNGFASEAPLDPRPLARKGLVVVSVAQRLNIFGYLALPQLTAEAGRSGNYGVADQLKAIEWIRANVAAFGGDPDNITVGGQSGGSQKAAVLVATPYGRGSVRRVVSQSGLKWKHPFLALADAEEHGREYLRAVGLSPDLGVEELRAIDVARLNRPVPRIVLPDYMVEDGDLLPYADFAEGMDVNAAGVDFLNGTTLGEADLYAPVSSAGGYRLAGEPPAQLDSVAKLRAHFRAVLGELYDDDDFDALVPVDEATAWSTGRRLASLGLAGRAGTNVSRSVMLDRIFGAHMARQHPGSRSYTYLWSHLVPPSPSDYGTPRDPAYALAWHGSETWYTFGSLGGEVSPGRVWTEADLELADLLSDYWVNFVSNGDPNGSGSRGTGLPRWPGSHDEFGFLELDNRPVATTGCASGLDRLIRAFVLREYRLDG